MCYIASKIISVIYIGTWTFIKSHFILHNEYGVIIISNIEIGTTLDKIVYSTDKFDITITCDTIYDNFFSCLWCTSIYEK